MPLPPDDRRRMRAVRLCGPRVISRLEAAGVTSFAELADADPDELVFRVNLAAGRPIWHPPMATRAMANLVEAAREAGAAEPAAGGQVSAHRRSLPRATAGR